MGGGGRECYEGELGSNQYKERKETTVICSYVT